MTVIGGLVPGEGLLFGENFCRQPQMLALHPLLLSSTAMLRIVTY